VTSSTDRRDFLRICGACAALTLAKKASAAAAPTGMDELLQREMRARRIPGLAVAIVQNEKLVHGAGYGMANLEWDEPVSADTVFHLASVTKPFTAMLVMSLVEEGKIALDSPISAYLPPTPKAWSDITVRHLLSHQSGLTERMFPNPSSMPTQLPTSLGYVQLASQPLDAAPGTKARYTDQGYFLLGMILEKVSGMPYQQLLRERIFKPAGMTSTTVMDQYEIVKHRAASYTMHQGKISNSRRWQAVNVELPSPYGVLSTGRDLARWDIALNTGKLLGKSAFSQMCTPATLRDGRPVMIYGAPYGLGWELGDLRGHPVEQHGGFSGTHFLRLPEDHLTIIVLTNLDVASGSQPDLLAKIVAGHYNPPLRPPQVLEPATDPEPARAQAIKQFLIDFGNGKESPLTTPGHRAWLAELPQEARQETARWCKELKLFAFLACDQVADRRINRLGAAVSDICYYRMTTPSATVCWTVYMTADHKIAHAVPDR
jgi:CubicO group peptidase (beta-lactamase class C family)